MKSRRSAICSGLTVGNSCDSSRTLISLTFRRIAVTGTRVPRNTHAPPCVSGLLSRTEQHDQSISVVPAAISLRPPNPILTQVSRLRLAQRSLSLPPDLQRLPDHPALIQHHDIHAPVASPALLGVVRRDRSGVGVARDRQ